MKNCLALSKQLKKWKYICAEGILSSEGLSSPVKIYL